MHKAERQLYRCLVRMHPAAFREQFGREMLLDFEDARTQFRFAQLCADCLLSLARQWVRCAVSSDYAYPCETRSSLLGGEYFMIRDQPLTVME